MALKQLSVYAENKKGTLANTTNVLAKAGVDMKSICIADTKDFGIFRIVVTDTEKALKVLKEEGFTVSKREVAAIAVENVPGELNRALQVLDAAETNIEYMYSIINNKNDKAYMAFRVDDNAETEALLKANGFEILTDEDI